MQELSGKVIFVTGSTDGLGKLVAQDLAAKGATILLHGRNPEKGQATLDEIREITKNEKLAYYNADFASLAEVRALSERLLAEHNRLDVLINNAGIGAGPRNSPRELSKDGYELRFAVNYLAPFLLTRSLLPLLQNAAPSRIINVASVGQEPIHFDDLMLEKQYEGFMAYKQSKLALIMFTFDLAQQLKDRRVIVNCLHPASLMNTKMVYEYFGNTMSTVEDGAEALEYVAISAQTASVTGVYFDGKTPAKAISQAYDMKARERLHEISAELTDSPNSLGTQTN